LRHWLHYEREQNRARENFALHVVCRWHDYLRTRARQIRSRVSFQLSADRNRTAFVRGILAKRFNRKTMKTLYRVIELCKNFEKPVYSRQFENHGSLWWNGSQFDIPVALHCLFHTAKKNLDSGAIELPDLGEVENQAGSIPL